MSARPWPPRRAGCAGDCQPGRRQCDCPLDPIDRLLRRADTDPSLPIGQDEPAPVRRRALVPWLRAHAGAVFLVALVLAVGGLLLAVARRAESRELYTLGQLCERMTDTGTPRQQEGAR